MNVLDLFSGIGGFSLGLERAGMRTVAFCEIDPYARAVLRKHWPDVPCYDDVRTLTADRLAANGIVADVICGGFPCQDISTAGRGAGMEGARSGLWSEYARIVSELRPGYVIVENVSALLGRGLDRVLGDLATLGYDAEWHCIPASAIGAPHRRDRVWILAHAQRDFSRSPNGRRPACKTESYEGSIFGGGGGADDVADAISPRRAGSWSSWDSSDTAPRISREAIDAFNGGIGNVWLAEPGMGRVANGVPARVDRLRALGNAVVPQIPEIIGRAIMRATA